MLVTRSRTQDAGSTCAGTCGIPWFISAVPGGYMSEVVRLDWPSGWPSLGAWVFRPF